MPMRCIVAGCGKTNKQGVSLHTFPKDKNMKRIWTAKVKLNRAHWEGPSDTSVICSAHFEASDFEDSEALWAEFGLKKKKRLKANAIPNIESNRRGLEIRVPESEMSGRGQTEWLSDIDDQSIVRVRVCSDHFGNDVSDDDFSPEKHDSAHVKQEEAELDTLYIKKEEEEDEITTFPIPFIVKSEEGEDGPSRVERTWFSNPTPKEVSEGDLHPKKQHPRHLKHERPYSSEEAEPESPYIKEEQEDEMAEFPMTVFGKNQEDEGPSGQCRAEKTLFRDLTPKEVSEGDLDPEKRDPLYVKRERPYILREAEPGRPDLKKEEDDIIHFPITVFVKSQEGEGPSGERAENPLFDEPTPTDVIEGHLDPEKHNCPHV
ncbi:uncharacterized protein LOC144194207 isoform X5 [Stigmatopora nigra]